MMCGKEKRDVANVSVGGVVMIKGPHNRAYFRYNHYKGSFP